MKQSRIMSLVEAVANVIVGYGVAVATQILIFPIFGLHTTLAKNLKMGVVFTIVSLVRSYLIRRLFDHFPSIGLVAHRPAPTALVRHAERKQLENLGKCAQQAHNH